MPIDINKLQAAFLQLVELPDPAARQARLAEIAATNPDLRHRLEALLQAHASPDSLLNRPPDFSAVPTRALLPESVPGAMIAGRYKLLELIGEGGMGLVWMAEQREPVRRLVALKLIKAGMDSRSVLARFDAERQALAMMDHPCIARVLDGGATDLGRPWFAMELVRGLPLTTYCDQRRMTIAQRLELFIQICSAVQHAHQKGIIHRDLKPSNVLITEHDGQPLPKVIDFGLAKALGGATTLTDQTLHTAYGAVAGTPLYMAPEQVAINALDIDTRADIFALGAILYELLTGTTPLERQRLKEAAWDEIRRVIHDEEPPRPSLRISTSQTLPSLAATRDTDPARLTGLLKGDLDWIILKALEKDRNRRYETANALAADLKRHLADEPVLAAPPSLTYRIQKLVRRNRAPIIAAALLLAVLIAGIATSALFAIRTHRANTLLAANNDHLLHSVETVFSEIVADKGLHDTDFEKLAHATGLGFRYDNTIEWAMSEEDRLRTGHLNQGKITFTEKLDPTHDNSAAIDVLGNMTIDAIRQERSARQQLTHERDTALEANRRADELSAKQRAFAAARCAEEGIRAEKENDTALALLFFARAVHIDPDSPAAEMNRRRFNIALHLLPKPVDVIPPDAAHMIFHGRALRWGGRGKALELIDARTSLPIPGFSFDLHLGTDDDRILYAEFSPDGNYVIAADGDHAYLFDAHTGRQTCPPMKHLYWAYITFTPDGRYIITTPDAYPVSAGKMILKSVPDGRDGPDTMPWGWCRFVGPKSHLMIINDGEKIRLWDYTTGKPVGEPLGASRGSGSRVAVSADGSRIAAFLDENKIGIWESASGRPTCPPIDMGNAGIALELSPDGKYILHGGGELWRLDSTSTGENVFSDKTQPGGAFWAAFSPDGKLVATINHDAGNVYTADVVGDHALDSVFIRNASTGEPICDPVRHPCSRTAFSPDNSLLVTIPDSGPIETWDIASLRFALPSRNASDQPVTSFYPTGGSITSPRDHSFAIRVSFGGGNDAIHTAVQFWDARTAERLAPPLRMPATLDPSFPIASSGTALFDGARVFNSFNGFLSTNPPPSAAAPWPGTSMPDPDHLLSASGNQFQILDPRSRRILAHVPLPWPRPPYLVNARFSPDSQFAVVTWSYSRFSYTPGPDRTSTTDFYGGVDPSHDPANAVLLNLTTGQSIPVNTAGAKSSSMGEFIAFDPQSRWTFLCHDTGALFCRMSDGSPLTLPPGDVDAVSPDASHFVLTPPDPNGHRGAISQLWQIRSTDAAPTLLSSFDAHDQNGANSCLSPDSHLLFNSTLVDTRTGASVAQRFDPIGKTYFGYSRTEIVAFSADNRSLIRFPEHSPIIEDISPIAAPVEQLELAAQALAARLINSDGLIVSDFSSAQTRTQFFQSCPDIYTATSQPEPKPAVAPAYRYAVDAALASATDEPSKMEIARQLAESSMIELNAAAFDHAILLANSALQLDPDNLRAAQTLAVADVWTNHPEQALPIFQRCAGKSVALDGCPNVFGQNYANRIIDLQKANPDQPALAKIVAILAPTTQPATTAPATSPTPP